MKLKQLFIISSLLLSSFMVGSVHATPNTFITLPDNKVYVVNVDLLLQNSKQFQEAQVSFQKTMENKQKELAKLEQSLAKEEQALAAEKTAIDNAIKNKQGSGAEVKKREDNWKVKAAAFEKKHSDFQKRAQNFQNEANQLQYDLNVKVENAIQKVIETYAKENKIKFILDSRTVIYAQEKVDVTEALVKLLK